MAFQKRELVDVKWESMGQSVAGWLTRMEHVAYQGKRNLLYHVTDQQSRVIRFYGTSEINDKLAPSDLGAAVMITFVQERPMSGGRAMKLFDVLVDADNRLSGFGGSSADEAPTREQPPIEAYEAA